MTDLAFSAIKLRGTCLKFSAFFQGCVLFCYWLTAHLLNVVKTSFKYWRGQAKPIKTGTEHSSIRLFWSPTFDHPWLQTSVPHRRSFGNFRHTFLNQQWNFNFTQSWALLEVRLATLKIRWNTEMTMLNTQSQKGLVTEITRQLGV